MIVAYLYLVFALFVIAVCLCMAFAKSEKDGWSFLGMAVASAAFYGFLFEAATVVLRHWGQS